MSDIALKISDVSYAYGAKQALSHVSFEVKRGQFMALLGANGAGKTTLISLITHLFETGQGTIEICGLNPAQDGPSSLTPLGIVFQKTTLDLDLTARQNLRYFGALRGLSRRQSDKRLEEALDTLAMLERVDERVRDMNGGHKRRVEIARAILHEPEIIILDEATVGLDVMTRKTIVEYVHNLAKEKNIAILWTSHLFDEVWPSDDLIILDQGKIIESGPVTDVLKRTQTTTVQGAFETLLGQVEESLSWG